MDLNKAMEHVNVLCHILEDDVKYTGTDNVEDEDIRLAVTLSTPVAEQLHKRRIFSTAEYEPTIVNDIIGCRFKGRTAEDLEHFRQEGLLQFKAEKNPLKKVKTARDYGREINKAVVMLDFMETMGAWDRAIISTCICHNMLEKGKYSLTDIKNAMPWLELNDIWLSAMDMGYDIPLTPEECCGIMDELAPDEKKNKNPDPCS